jgi:hypothetical protein
VNLQEKSVGQIRRQIPTEASGVRQFNKVHHKMIRVRSETSAIVGAVAAYFFFDGRHMKISTNKCIGDIPRGVHYHAQGLRLEPF